MIQTHPHMLDEILSEINKSQNPEERISHHLKNTSFFRDYMVIATDDVWCSVDPTTIEFKQYSYHRSMAGAFLLNRHTMSIVKSVILADDVPDEKKIIQMKALFTMLYEGEYEVLNCIFQKNLEAFYPVLTHEFISKSL